MAGGILAILDDVAMLLDDAAAMSKVAAKKTAGLLGDDLAVNAEKATGFHASRELPVIWAITKGSFKNKLIILPLAFLLSTYMAWIIVPILLIGGAYLSYEGAEKIWEWLFHRKKSQPIALEIEDKNTLLQSESKKIKAAVRTDFILSIEIIIIALETVLQQSLLIQIIVVSFIAIVATIGVYGFVALLVRMDDSGIALIQHAHTRTGLRATLLKTSGKTLVAGLPKIIRLLGFIGTIAMLLVGGGMYVHNIEYIHHWLVAMPTLLADLLVGLVVGGLVMGLIQGFKTIKLSMS